MVHRGHSNWKVQETVNKRRHFVRPAREGVLHLPACRGGRRSAGWGRALALIRGGVQLLEQALEVSQSLRPAGVLERLVLGEHVHEALAEVVAVPAQSLTSAVAEPVDNLPDLALGAEPVRDPAQAARPS